MPVKKRVWLFCLAAALAFGAAGGTALADGGGLAGDLGSLELRIMGSIQPGALGDRTAALERVLFGRALPGPLAERLAGMGNLLVTGDEKAPSLEARLAAAEWAVFGECRPGQPDTDRLAGLEKALSGAPCEGALAMRTERAVTALFPEGLEVRSAVLDNATPVSVKLGETLDTRTARAGMPVKFSLAGDLRDGDVLLAPKGTPVTGTVESVKPPRSFGRKAEITLKLADAVLPDGTAVPLVLDLVEQKAAASDPAVAAAGTSFAGLVLLGPVGLAGGFMVRGDTAEIPAGIVMPAQTDGSAACRGVVLKARTPALPPAAPLAAAAPEGTGPAEANP